MKGIVVSCPRCSKNIDLGYQSKFEIYDCPHCTYRFRGIYAHNVGRHGGNVSRIIKRGLRDIVFIYTAGLSGRSCESANNLHGDTPCPFCRRNVNPSAEQCPHCTRNLPWTPAGEWRRISCPGCPGEIRAFDWAAGSMPEENDVNQCQSCSTHLNSTNIPAEFRCGNCNAVNCADLTLDVGARCNWCKEVL